MSPEEALARGAAAERLLADETLTNAFEAVRHSILESLEEWPIEDRDGAEKLRLSLKLLKGVRSHLEKTIRNGQVAKYQLEERERSLKQRVYDALRIN